MKQVQHIMDKYLVKKRITFTSKIIATSALLSVVLSGCVTQDYENDKTPVVQNQANRDDMAATRISLGLGYLKMGNMPQAKQNLEKAKNFAPEMVQVYTAFAHYYETVDEHKLTVESYEKALLLKGDDADTLNNYGVYLCRQNQVEAAEKQFLKAIAVPSYILVSKSYENLSSCFLQKNDFDKAEIYLSKAIAHNPSSASTLFQMVRLQYAMADYKQAKAFEQRFEKVTRRFTSQSLALAFKVYTKLGQKRTAKNYGTMLVKMYPQSWEAQQYLLNELERIEADNLAKRYQLTKVSTKPAKQKKRIVKLSPKKTSPVNNELKREVKNQTPTLVVKKSPVLITLPVSNTSSDAINAALTSAVVEPKTDLTVLTASTDAIHAALTSAVVEPKTDLTVLTASSDAIHAALTTAVVEPKTNLTVSTASSDVINAALTTAVVEPKTDLTVLTASSDAINTALTTTVVEPKSIAVASVTTEPLKTEVEKKVIVKTPANMNTQDKQVVMISEPEIEQPANAEQTVITRKEVSLEDTEIFHIAKKPAPIVEDVAKEIVEIKVVGKKDLESIKKESRPVIIEQPPKKKTKNFPDFHVVEEGDTLYNISVQYNIKIKALRKWNKIYKNKRIHIKDIIFLENPKSVNK